MADRLVYNPKTNSISRVSEDQLPAITPAQAPVSSGGGDFSSFLQDYVHGTDVATSNAVLKAKDIHSAVAAFKGRKVGQLSPELQKLYSAVTSEEKKVKDTEAQSKKPHGFVGHVLDILSRANYASADVAKSIVDEVKNKGVLNTLAKEGPGILTGGSLNIAQHHNEVWKGLSGKERNTYSDVLKDIDPNMNKWAALGIGLTGDILLDPTTYIGVGAVKSVVKGSVEGAKGLSEAAKAAKVADMAGTLTKYGIKLEDYPSEISKAQTITERLSQPLGELGPKAGIGKKGKAVAKSTAATKQLHIEDANKFINAVHIDLSDAVTKSLTTERLLASAEELAKLSPEASKVARSAIRKTARVDAKKQTQGITDGLTNILLKQNDTTFKRLLEVKLNVPFTKINNPDAARVLFRIAAPHVVSQMVEKAANVDVVKNANKVFSDWFKSSAGLDPVLSRLRLNGIGSANKRVHIEAERLRSEFKDFDPAHRAESLRLVLKGQGNVPGKYEAVNKTVQSEIDNFAGLFSHDAADRFATKIDRTLVNSWLPKDFQLSPADLNGPNPVAAVKQALQHVPTNTDPARLFWHLNLAREKILAHEGIKRSLRSQFGIPVGLKNEAAARKAGYTEVNELGKGFLYSPDIAPQIDKTLKLMKNQSEINKMLKEYDRVMSLWKASVTLYNPGYHARNAGSDLFVNYLAGVAGREGYKSYRQALRAIKTLNPVESDPIAAALKQMDPHKAWNDIKSSTPDKTLFKHNGKDVSIGDIVSLYHKAGLPSGFIHTEFDANLDTANTIRSTPIGKAANKVNRGVTKASEYREDWFRLAHFIDKIKRTPGSLEHAADMAADEVRKYNFDYGDFTQAEKQVMSRVFPFYKWIRKAMPLMVESLFAQPGKVNLYPKAMRELSQAQGYEGNNGIIPGSDDIIPEWIRSTGENYPLYSHGKNTVFAGAAVPFQDAIRTIGSPVTTAGSSLNPLLANIAEHTTHKTLYSGQDINSVQEQALSNAPPQLSALLALIRKGKKGNISPGVSGLLTDPRFLQFITGLSLPENTEGSMMSELLRRKEIANKKLSHSKKSS